MWRNPIRPIADQCDGDPAEGVDSESLGLSISRDASYEALNDEERTGKISDCGNERGYGLYLRGHNAEGIGFSQWLGEAGRLSKGFASGQLGRTKSSSAGSGLHPISAGSRMGMTGVYAGAEISASQAEGGHVLTYPNWNFHRAQPPHPTHVLRCRR